jgi:hypothetical protein
MPINLNRKNDAGPHSLTIEKNGTRAADAVFTPNMCAG